MATLTDDDKRTIARRWFDAVNAGDEATLESLLAPNVVDHSGLNDGHGGGSDGHKQLVRQLRNAFPGWESKIDDLKVEGDRVTINHSGSGIYPSTFGSLMGRPPSGAEMRRIEFKIVSRIRIDDTEKIVEHWADQTPIGRSGCGGGEPTPPYPPSGGPPGTGTGTLEVNKLFLQNYVKNVIDGQNPSLAGYYFAENFYNHDRAPGEAAGLAGVTAFLQSIFAAFSGFQTTIEQQRS